MSAAAVVGIEEQMRGYYAQRAAYYERVYFKPERQGDLRAMEASLPALFAGRCVLEVACGTGWWTPHGARDARSWLATDLNPGTMDIARSKPLPACVRFETVDAYTFEQIAGRTFDGAASGGAPSFDGAFAGCWWSHVPLARLAPWLQLLHERLEPGGRVVMLDNRHVQTSNLPITRRDAEGNTYQMRSLDDGSRHEVLKNFPTRDEAFAAIGPRARDPQWIEYGHYWVLSYLLS